MINVLNFYAPEYKYPIPGSDCFNSYKWLVESIGSPANVIVFGSSAGGALAVETLVRARNVNFPMPQGMILMSPWVDILNNSRYPSQFINAEFEGFNLNPAEDLFMARMYTNDDSVSPINQDLTGFPPLLIEVGDAEVMRDQMMSFFDKAKNSGVSVECNKYANMIHCFQNYFESKQPECEISFQNMKIFIDNLDSNSFVSSYNEIDSENVVLQTKSHSLIQIDDR